MSERNSSGICHMTSAHRPDDTRIFLKECRSLARAYGNVSLVAAADESNDSSGDVKILTVSKPGGRLERMSATTVRVFARSLATHSRVFHFHDPELMPAALALKALGKRVVIDVHEDVSAQILAKYWMPRSLRRMVSRGYGLFESAAIQCLDAVVAATPPIGAKFPDGKTVVVQNFPMLDEMSFEKAPPFEDRPVQACFVGNISAIRGIVEMVEALESLTHRIDARLELCGSFSPVALEEEVKKLPGWKQVDFRGWVNREEMAAALGRSRVGLLPFHPLPNHVEAYPTKLFEYMAAGLPVVASDFPLWRSIVEEAGCGLLVDPLDSGAMADALVEVLGDPEKAQSMGERGREAVLKKYNWEAEEKKLLTLYSRLEE